MRPAAAALVAGLVLAAGVPATWAVTRPDAAAGLPLAEVLAAPPAPTTAPAVAPPTAPMPATAAPTAAAPTTATPTTATPTTAAPAPAPTQAPVAPPVRLRVPGLGVEAPVDPVGVDEAGAMALPDDVRRVGWYRFGPAPGAPAGSAVLAGHVDDAEQGLGAVAPLRTADAGTEVLVDRADGTTGRWRVVSREVVEKRALPLDQLFDRSGPPRLVLITCGGPFLEDVGAYRDNVVVVAEPLP